MITPCSFVFRSIRKFTRCLYFLASIITISAILPPVHAQNAGDIEEIIVTVERREQSLQDLAGTAAVITGEELKQLGIGNIQDLDGKIPGLSIANNQGNIEVYIRGIGSSNNTELGDPAAATHLNGVYVPRPSGFGSAFFDIQRVEVNIGPQGTLRGRNATAGSVNVIPWQPGLGEFDSMLEISLGDYDEKRFEGMVNIPVTENSALRVAGFKLTHDSYYTNANPSDATGLGIPTSAAEGIGVSEAADNGAIRAAYLVEGLGNWHKLLEPLTVTVTYDYLSEQGSGYTGTNYSSVLGAIGRGVNIDLEDLDPRNVLVRPITPKEDTVHYGIKGQLDYTTEWFDIEYIASYRDLIYDYQFGGAADTVVYPGALNGYEYFPQDNPSTMDVDESMTRISSNPFDFDNFSRVALITDSKSKIHELRLFSEELANLPLRWNVGTFYFEEDQRTFLGTASDRNAFFNGNEFNQRTNTESYSVYSDATYSVTSKFRITGGVRYTDDHKERTGVNARYAFIIGGEDFAPGSTAIGTEGFEFRGLGRTIINPDTDANGEVTSQDVVDFYFDGISQFGERDGIDEVLANGVVGGGGNGDVNNLPLCPDVFVGSACPTPGGTVDGIFPGNAGRLSYAVLGGSSIALQNGQLDNDFIDWRIRSEYDIGDDNLVYGMIATGNKSGGFNDNIPNVTDISFGDGFLNFDGTTPAPTYGPETVMLFELGSKNEFDVDLSKLFKSDFWDVGVKFNVSGFYYDYTDLQVFNLLSSAQILTFNGVPIPPSALDQLGGNVVGFTFNASDAEIFGAQFDGGFQFPSDWNFNYTFLWLETEILNSQEVQDSRFQADVDAVNAVNRSIEGHRLPRTPQFQLNMALSKAFPTQWGTFDAILSAGYRSEQHMTIFNGRVYDEDTFSDADRGRVNDLVDAYWTLDAGAGYSYGDDDALRVELYMSNVTDEQQEQAITITQFENTRFFSAPRTYGIRLRMRF